MVQATHQRKPLSAHFTDPYLRDAFQRDTPPAALAVEIEPRAPLAPGAVVRPLVEA